ncbi:MAG: hypothetical protein H6Q04_2164, partial [Acidobacteria bacterium]|nr:hypothetical protein [Acidobacteriota bacterium]
AENLRSLRRVNYSLYARIPRGKGMHSRTDSRRPDFIHTPFHRVLKHSTAICREPGRSPRIFMAKIPLTHNILVRILQPLRSYPLLTELGNCLSEILARLESASEQFLAACCGELQFAWQKCEFDRKVKCGKSPNPVRRRLGQRIEG